MADSNSYSDISNSKSDSGSQEVKERERKLPTLYAILAHLKKSMNRFSMYFVVFGWVQFFAFGRNVPSTIILLCSGLYLISDLLRDRRRKSE